VRREEQWSSGGRLGVEVEIPDATAEKRVLDLADDRSRETSDSWERTRTTISSYIRRQRKEEEAYEGRRSCRGRNSVSACESRGKAEGRSKERETYAKVTVFSVTLVTVQDRYDMP
jgi:hypothetical protein